MIRILQSVALLLIGVAASSQVAFNQYTSNTFWPGVATDARVLMVDPAGRLWVGSGDGSIRILQDTNQDGVADSVKVFVAGTFSPHGLAHRATANGGQEIFIAHTSAPVGGTGRITRFIDSNGDDIPDGADTMILAMPTGAHQVNNIKLDPTGSWLYFSQGATSDTTPGGGALIGRIAPSATNLLWGDPAIQIVATGLRNGWGIEFHPSGELFSTDNGRDDMGPLAPADEFNHITLGGDYGFPNVSGTAPPGSSTISPIGLLEPHASANGFTFDTGKMMTGFENQVFIAEWGSWSSLGGGAAIGRKIVQANLHQNAAGDWRFSSQDFLLDCGYPLDCAIGTKGELYFSVQTPMPGFVAGVHRVVPTSGTCLKLSGVPAPGLQVTARIHAPTHALDHYQVLASLGIGPLTTPLGSLALTMDAVMMAALQPDPYLQFAAPGLLDPNGDSSGIDRIVIPPVPGLSGFTIFLAAVTWSPSLSSLTSVTPTARLTII